MENDMQRIELTDEAGVVLCMEDRHGGAVDVDVPRAVLNMLSESLSAGSCMVFAVESTHDLRESQMIHNWFRDYPKARFAETLCKLAEIFEAENPGTIASALPRLGELKDEPAPLKAAKLSPRMSLFKDE